MHNEVNSGIQQRRAFCLKIIYMSMGRSLGGVEGVLTPLPKIFNVFRFLFYIELKYRKYAPKANAIQYPSHPPPPAKNSGSAHKKFHFTPTFFSEIHPHFAIQIYTVLSAPLYYKYHQNHKRITVFIHLPPTLTMIPV